MQNYIAVIDQKDDSAFGLWFPDIPGCFSAADAADDITKNALEAISLHLDGGEGPAARHPATVAQDPDVRAAIADGAWLLEIRYIGPLAETKTRITISIDDAVLSAIDSAADQRGQNRSAFLTEAARREVERA